MKRDTSKKLEQLLLQNVVMIAARYREYILLDIADKEGAKKKKIGRKSPRLD